MHLSHSCLPAACSPMLVLDSANKQVVSAVTSAFQQAYKVDSSLRIAEVDAAYKAADHLLLPPGTVGNPAFKKAHAVWSMAGPALVLGKCTSELLLFACSCVTFRAVVHV